MNGESGATSTAAAEVQSSLPSSELLPNTYANAFVVSIKCYILRRKEPFIPLTFYFCIFFSSGDHLERATSEYKIDCTRQEYSLMSCE